MRVPYIRTGYESIIPIRVSDKFAITAKYNGYVNKLTASEMEVVYDAKTPESSPQIETYRIKNWTSKEESNACYTHIMVPNLKKGDKFVKDDTLIYDSSFFEPDIFNLKRVLYKQGTFIKVALLEDKQTYEDSAAISDEMSGALAATVTKVKSMVVNSTDNVYAIKQPGDSIEPNDVLFTITDNIIGDTSKLDARTIEILEQLKSSSPKAKVKGKVNKIVVYYNCEYDTMSDTLKKIIDISDTNLIKNTGFTGRVNSSYSITGTSLSEGKVEIKIYIDTIDTMGIGDKAIFANQLKFTVGEVYNYDIVADDGTKVDAVFSTRSIKARIVNSPDLIGTTSMVLERLKDEMVSTYFNTDA